MSETNSQSGVNNTSSNSSRYDVVCVLGNPQEQALITKVEPVVKNLGYGLQDLQVTGGAGFAVVRIVLENRSVNEPIGIDDCQKVHDTLSPMFDVWDPVKGAYTLEISSPGEKPNLRLVGHFDAAVGQNVHVETIEALPVPPPAKPRRNWDGVLKSVDADKKTLTLEDATGEYHLSFDQIKTAVWLRDWTISSPKPSNKKKKMEK